MMTRHEAQKSADLGVRMRKILSVLAVGLAATAGTLAVAAPANAAEPNQVFFSTYSDCINYGINWALTQPEPHQISCQQVPVKNNGTVVDSVYGLFIDGNLA